MTDFVLIAFCEEDANTQDLSDALSEHFGFDIVVAVRCKNLCQSFWTGQ